ncbi:hypothetical protein ABK040_001801 [Willaertia magna]
MSGNNPEDLTLPKATIQKLIKEHLSGDSIRCANETTSLIVDCCVEFVQMIAAQSNSICGIQKKKTIAGEHVIEALNQLGYQEYIQPVNEVYSQFKLESARHSSNSKKLKNSGMTHEQLKAEQDKLIEQSRARTSGSSNTPVGMPNRAAFFPSNSPTGPLSQPFSQSVGGSSYSQGTNGSYQQVAPVNLNIPPPLSNAVKGEVIPINY